MVNAKVTEVQCSACMQNVCNPAVVDMRERELPDN